MYYRVYYKTEKRVGIIAKTPQSLDMTGFFSFKKAFGNVLAASEILIKRANCFLMIS